jgi:DNA-binding beta-propeller fold protein YncE
VYQFLINCVRLLATNLLTQERSAGWGGPGGQPGQFNGPHSITVDQEGNLYLAEVFNGRVQKFRPKAGADKAKLVGQELRYTGKS